MTRFWAKIGGLCSRLCGEALRDNAALGQAGERAAEAHLRAAGLRVVTRNWRNPADAREEIDLVLNDSEVLVFAEVKARSASAQVSGYSAVDRRKKKVLLRACRAYLAQLRPPASHYRFDIVEVRHGVTEKQAQATGRMNLDKRLTSVQKGDREVWHYRDVPLFPERASHRHR
jgi:putative endonuclease